MTRPRNILFSIMPQIRRFAECARRARAVTLLARRQRHEPVWNAARDGHILTDNHAARIDTERNRRERVDSDFGELTIDEVAEVTQVSSSTVAREWTMTKAWLRLELCGS